LLKSYTQARWGGQGASFSTLQRVEIAEIDAVVRAYHALDDGFSTLQRVEIAEIGGCWRCG